MVWLPPVVLTGILYYWLAPGELTLPAMKRVVGIWAGLFSEYIPVEMTADSIAEGAYWIIETHAA